jgi:hypothetical protein
MNRLFVVLVAGIVSTPSIAADRSVFIEACSAMTDASKRADCFEALARMAPGKEAAPDPKMKYEGVNRMATALQSAIDVGVSYNQFGVYVQQLATEISLLKQSAKEKRELAAIAEFESALDAYQDASTWWNSSVRFYAQRDNQTAYAWGLPLGLAGVEWLANKYSMPVGKADLLGFHRGVPHLTGLQTIWRVGRERVEKATTALSAPPAQAQAPAPASTAESAAPIPGQ